LKSFRDRMMESAERSRSRIVLALDVTGPHGNRLARAEKVLDATKGGVAAVKVNHQLLLPFGLEGAGEIITKCQGEGLPLIADLKMNDIESTNLDVVDSLLAYGFDAVIANPFVGKEEGLGGVIEKMHTKGGGVILLVYMSHKGAGEGYALEVKGGKPLYAVFAERARDWGADGIIVSAKSPEMIAEARRIVGKECLILSPGVGAQGGTRRGAAPGADFAIVGRSITEAEDPKKALAEITLGAH
jgi:orotidine-5'-phosphate decarboxylase